MAFLLAYEPTPSQGASSLSVDQQTNQQPSAYLLSYSTVGPSRWQEEAAQEVLRTSHDFDDIKHIIKFTPGLDLTIAVTLLCSRRKSWLNAFWTLLYQGKTVNKPSCDSALSTAEAIVAIIRQRSSSPTRAQNGDWIFSALISLANIPTIAEKLDTQIYSTFCTFAFKDWVTQCHGYQDNGILNFLDTIFNFRNKLAQHAREHAAMANGLVLL